MSRKFSKHIQNFISEYTQAISAGTAAIFAGAGLSCNSGFVNWKELLRNIAECVNLDIDKEHDLISLTQYYKNEMGGNRSKLNNEILSHFTKSVTPSKCMEILATLPIDTFWTTNYDHVIEDSLKRYGKIVDVKITQSNLAESLPKHDAIVYKFHGDILFPADAILTKDDYELFDITHKLFITSLQGCLVSKTFVFIGYSLSDPNFLQILSRIRVLLGENVRMHYFLTKKFSRQDFKNTKEFSYACAKRELMLNDLKRYGIKGVEIQTYDDIPRIFECVKKLYFLNKIFIAGSCRHYGQWKYERAYEFMYQLGYKLIKNGFHISTGLIEGVGPQVVNGALTAIEEDKLNIETSLTIKTLPLIKGCDKHIQPMAKNNYQQNMISQVGIVIFLFGNQYYDNELEISRGVMHDYERALEQKKYIIPVGSTGFAAENILNDIENNIEKFPYLRPFISQLRNEKDTYRLVALIFRIIDYIRNNIESF